METQVTVQTDGFTMVVTGGTRDEQVEYARLHAAAMAATAAMFSTPHVTGWEPEYMKVQGESVVANRAALDYRGRHGLSLTAVA